MTQQKLPIQTPERIRAMRTRYNLTQAQAAELVHVSVRAWQMWEADDRVMPTATWELFLLKIGDRML